MSSPSSFKQSILSIKNGFFDKILLGTDDDTTASPIRLSHVLSVIFIITGFIPMIVSIAFTAQKGYYGDLRSSGPLLWPSVFTIIAGIQLTIW